MHRLPVNFGAGLIDDNDRKRGIFEPTFVPEPLCKLLAMLNRTCGGRKLYARSVPDWSAILHIKIIGSHNDPSRRAVLKREGRDAPEKKQAQEHP